MRIRVAIAVVLLLSSLTACRKKTHVAVPPPTPRSSASSPSASHPTPAPPPVAGSKETGIASWYGYPYHGRRAADGEIYDMEQMTAAHRTLPFNTWVQVRNLSNEMSCQVRITDRGPFVDGRVIDLSKAAARSIEMLGPGTARVELTIIAPPPGAAPQPLFAVQVGAFRDRERAERIRDRMEAQYGKARIVERFAATPFWRVLVGEEATQESASALARRISDGGSPALVVRLDTPASD
jgi:rare lipoprotein A